MTGPYSVVRHCEFNSIFNAIAMSGSLCVVEDINCRNWAGTVIAANTNTDKMVEYINAENPCQAIGGIVLNGASSIRIQNCSISQCGVALDVNPGPGVTIPSIYVSNCYFDSSLYGIRLRGSGTGSIYRSHFVNTWACSALYSGVSFETANIDGVDFVNCDFLGNGTYGVNATGGGGQGWSLDTCRIAGNATAGVGLAPNASANLVARIHDCTIGPTGAFGANGVGISVAAGTYARLFIQNNDLSGNTGAGIVDNSTTVAIKDFGSNLGGTLLGGVAAVVANVALGSTTELQIVGTVLPAGALQPGTTFRLRALGQTTVSVSGTITFRLRIGPTTLSGNVIASIANTTVNGTAIGFAVEVIATVRAIGVSGSIDGMMLQTNTAATGLTATPNAVGPANGAAPVAQPVNTTVANILEFTAQTSTTNSTPTFYLAEIEIVKP